MEQTERKRYIHRLNWKSWPLAVKLTLAMTTMVIIAVATVTLLSIRREQQTFRAELQQQADLLLDALEAATPDLLYYQDSDTLTNIMQALGENREILVFGRIYDAEGWIIADAYDEALAYSIENDPFWQKLIESKVTVFEWQPNQLIAGRAVSVERQLLGAVSVGLPMAPLQDKVASMRKQGISAALAATVIGILLALLVGHSITSPLRELVKATNHIAKGDLTQKITIHTHDELAVLGDAMDHMRSELYELYQNLEQQVADRTRALQESEARFRQVISSISDVIYMAEVPEDGNWINRYISPNIKVLTGYPVEKFMTGSNFWPSLIYPEDRAMVAACRDQFSKDQKSSVEYRITRADDSFIWIRDNARIEKDELRNSLTIYGVLSDITSHKQAEEALRKLEKAVETTEVGITITDNDGRIVYTNPADAKMHGYTVDELIGQCLTIFAPPKQQEPAPRSGEEGKALLHWKRERLNVRKDGSTFPVMLISNPITDAQGHSIGKVVVCEDITERKRAEEALQQRNNELSLINQVSQMFSSTIEWNQVLETVLSEMRRLLNITATSFWLRVPETGELICQQSVGPGSETVVGWRLAPGQGIVGQAAQTGETIIIVDTRTDTQHYKGVDQKTRIELRSILSIPFRVKGEVIGVLSLMDTVVDRFTEDDLRLVEPIAAAAASAIENARLYMRAQQEIAERKQAEKALLAAHNELKKEKKRADDLLEIVIPLGVELTTEKDFNRLLEKMLLDAKTFCHADAGTLYLRTEDEQLKFAIVRNDTKNIAMGGTTGQEIPFAPMSLKDQTPENPDQCSIVARVALSGISSNVSEYDRPSEITSDYPITSLLTIPLKDNFGQVLGVMQLLNAQNPETGQVIPFDQNLQRMMESFSLLAVAALEAYIREQSLKQEIQRLRIEIDEAKRQKQVHEIVESDSFKDLQAKASEMRRRRGKSVQRKDTPKDSAAS
jgi:PAS domain S-box-containing protein